MATAPPAASEGGWYVVLGAFSSRERARDHLEAIAVAGRVLPGPAQAPYRSAAGPHASRDAAEARRRALAERFPGAWLVQHTP